MEQDSEDTFTEMGTIGIEEEFYVVDAAGRPTAGTDTLVYNSTPPELLDGRLDHELFKCVIETQTPTISQLSDVQSTVRNIREALCSHAREHGYQIAAAGLHPTAKWRELEHAEKPRYKEQLNRIQYPQHRNLTAGLHIHVGVDDPDKAMWIANELRWYVPVLLALSVNSPYWYGFDTGLASARAKIFEGLPNTGIPTMFEDFHSYRRYEQRMLATDSINDRGEIWFDLRPHTAHGTVEIRAPDTQANPRRVHAFTEFVVALVEECASLYEDGVAQTEYRREILDENKWRAIRYGQDASFIRPDGSTVGLAQVINEECDRLGIDGPRELLAEPSRATRQREIMADQGAQALREHLIIEP